MIGFLVFLIIINLLIIVHEFGHFIAARKLGVRVYEFAIGFGPRLFSLRKGLVTYSIRLFPFGGFVHIEEEGEDGIFKASLLRQVVIVLAGVVLNLILAYVVLLGYLNASKYSIKSVFGITPYFAQVVKTKEYVILNKTLIPEHELAEYTLQTGKLYAIVEVSGTSVKTVQQLRDVLETARKQGLNKVRIVLVSLEDNKSITKEVSLNNEGKLGIEVFEYAETHWRYNAGGVVKKLTAPIRYMFDFSLATFKLTVAMLDNSPKELVNEGIGGPVALYAVVDSMLKNNTNFVEYLSLLGLLSLNLAFLNLLPFPPLDGWQLVRIFVYRFVPAKRVRALVKILTVGGVVVIILLSVAVTIKDFKIFIFKR